MQELNAPAPPTGGRLAAAYARLKSGKGWVVTLLAILAVALPLSIRFDPDFGALNLFLSVEASLSQALSYGGEMALLAVVAANVALLVRLARQGAEADERAARHDRYMLDLLEAQRDVLAALGHGGAAGPAARPGMGEPGAEGE
jgi:hypothetical protein